MSRSYAVLAAALVGVIGLAGVAQLTGSSADAGDSESSSQAVAPAAPAAVAAESEAADAEQTQLAAETGGQPGLDPTAVGDPDCTLSVRLEMADENDEVACLESRLIAAGVLAGSTPDSVFDSATELAVRAFQARHGLVVDGVVGPQTAMQLGSWVGPDVLPPDPSTCPSTGRTAVVDRFNQRTWLCEGGEITEVMPITSALSQPDPGTYSVYAKDLNASSTVSGEYSEMTHFVAFTYGKYQGARIAFHSVPTYPNGEYIQPLDSVGTEELHGASAGCIRVLPADAEVIWDWLDIGDTVTVVS